MSTNSSKQAKILERTVHSAWGQLLQTQSLLGLPINPIPFTTLNEHPEININTNKRIGKDERMVVGYYCIGYGGHEHRNIVGKPNVPTIVPHDPTDAGLYNMMPFALRRKNNDFDDAKRAEYRLRKIVNVDGTDYIAYYLKRFTTTNTVNLVLETTINGVKSIHPYTPNINNLQPQRPQLAVDRAETASNTKVKVSSDTVIRFTPEDVNELLEVSRILYGSSEFAVISEIGLVGAIDENNFRGEDNVAYTEVKNATIMSFLHTYHWMQPNSDGFTETLELAEKVPLYTHSPILATVGIPVAGA